MVPLASSVNKNNKTNFIFPYTMAHVPNTHSQNHKEKNKYQARIGPQPNQSIES